MHMILLFMATTEPQKPVGRHKIRQDWPHRPGKPFRPGRAAALRPRARPHCRRDDRGHQDCRAGLRASSRRRLRRGHPDRRHPRAGAVRERRGGQADAAGSPPGHLLRARTRRGARGQGTRRAAGRLPGGRPGGLAPRRRGGPRRRARGRCAGPARRGRVRVHRRAVGTLGRGLRLRAVPRGRRGGRPAPRARPADGRAAPAPSPAAVEDAARAAAWQLPATLAALVWRGDDERRPAHRLPIGSPSARLRDDSVCALVPDAGAPGQLAELRRMFDGESAALGPVVPWQETWRSAARAGAALALADRGAPARRGPPPDGPAPPGARPLPRPPAARRSGRRRPPPPRRPHGRSQGAPARDARQLARPPGPRARRGPRPARAPADRALPPGPTARGVRARARRPARALRACTRRAGPGRAEPRSTPPVGGARRRPPG